MIRAIEIDTLGNYIDELGHPLTTLYDVERINIFVGENNSGKSRLMRAILSSKSSIPITNACTDTKNNFNNQVNSIIRTAQDINQNSNITPNLQFDQDKIKGHGVPDNYYDTYKCISKSIHKWFHSIKGEESDTAQGYHRQLTNHINNLRDMLRPRVDAYGTKKSITELYEDRCYYIPVLRGIENFDTYFDKTPLEQLDEALLNKKQWQAIDNYAANAKQIYQNKIHNVYGISRQNIFTAENLYEEVRDKLLGTEKQREQIRNFQNFISQEFYEGNEVTIIPQQTKINSDATREYLSVKIGKSNARPIYNLGDGIKQMITILYKIYEKTDEAALFFIEEPELNLHPGYQRRLIQILQSDAFKKHQFFIVTHSNHIIESSLITGHTSLYKVINVSEKNNQFQVIATTNRDIEILNLLGVSNGSVFMANCLIFVEGISDKIIIQKYLEVFMQKEGYKFKEDIHYAFIETGGGNIAHWNFMTEADDADAQAIKASSFSNRSFIICDNDGDAKPERKAKLKQMVGDKNFYILPVREIENTIKRSVLERTLFKGNKAELKEGKDYNENDKTGYDDTQTFMGEFIDSHYKLNKKYAAPSGTIKNKLQFAREIASNISTAEDLSDTAVELCNQLVEFIQASNRLT